MAKNPANTVNEKIQRSFIRIESNTKLIRFMLKSHTSEVDDIDVHQRRQS
jgi:hypothetical protein